MKVVIDPWRLEEDKAALGVGLCEETCQRVVNYGDGWGDYPFNGPGAPAHIWGNDSPIIWPII